MANQSQDPEALRNSLTREVTTDADVIAGQIFRGPQGDVGRVSNDELDQRYRQAFLSNDRQYLMQEAVRDPAQFLESMARLQVQMPPGEEVPQEPPLPKAAQSNVKIPQVHPEALPQTYATPEEVPATAPPALPAPAPMPGAGPAFPMAPPQPAPPPLAPGPAGAPMPPPGVIA